MYILNRILIMKNWKSNLSNILVIFPNALLDFASGATEFAHVWDSLLCFAGRTREVPGLRLVERQCSQGLYNRAVFPKVGYVKDEQKGIRRRGDCGKYGWCHPQHEQIFENTWQWFIFLGEDKELRFQKLGKSRPIPVFPCFTESFQPTSSGNMGNLVINGHVLSLCLKPMPRWPILHISTKNKVTSFSKVLSTSCSHCVHKPHYRFLFSNSCPQKNFQAAQWLYVLPLALCLFILVQI